MNLRSRLEKVRWGDKEWQLGKQRARKRVTARGNEAENEWHRVILSRRFRLKMPAGHVCCHFCCHIWAGAPSCYLDVLDKLQKRICSTASSPTLAASFEPLVHRRNKASLSIFNRYYLVDIRLNWLNWLLIPYSRGSSLVILIDCLISLSPFLDVTRMYMSTVSFLAQLDPEILYLRNAFFWPMI